MIIITVQYIEIQDQFMSAQKLIVLGILFTATTLIYFYQPPQQHLQMTQESANFSENDKIDLRHLVQKANILYYPDYTGMGVYLKKEMTYNYDSLWNIVVYLNQDYLNQKFYITGKYDEEHLTKKYFQVTDSQPHGVSILILEANNTPGWSSKNEQRTLVESKGKRSQTPLQKKLKQLRFSKDASANVNHAQEDVIDDALVEAFIQYGPDLVNFTKQFYRQIQSRFIGKQYEVWDICTSHQDMPNFSLRFTSPDYTLKWIDYSFFGEQEQWHITVWNHFTNLRFQP